MKNLSDKGALLFQDNKGRILNSSEVDKLSAWEIEDRGITVYEENT